MKKAASGTAEKKNLEETDQLLQRDPWKWWREKMPVTGQWAYFDHAAVSPLSAPAVEAIGRFAGEASASGDMSWPQWSAKAEHLRHQFSHLLNSHPSEICLIPNTTSGVNLVAEGLDWQPGDNVIVPEGEFPSNLFPWENQASKGVEIRLVPRRTSKNSSGGQVYEVAVDDLIEQIDKKTRLIAVSWVGYASGFRIDLDRLVDLAHQRGVLVFLDSIQGLGIFPLDLKETPVDFMAADGHKWLLGPEGIGMAMIRQEHLDHLRCGQVGWNSVKQAFNYSRPKFNLRDAASRFEGGSTNLLGVAALSASVDLFAKVREVHGDDAISKRILMLAGELESRLETLGIKTRLSDQERHRSGIVTFEISGIDPAAFRKVAIQENVVLSCRDGGVRASIHAYNTSEDLDRLVAVIEQQLG